MKFHAKKVAGKFIFSGSKKWMEMRLAELPDDVEYSWEVKRYKKPRSLPQNAYLHSVLIPCFHEALNQVGYDEVRTDEQAKQIIKNMFLKTSVVNHETGEALEYVKDTHDLTTEEMSILWEDVWKFASEHLNYVIPAPGQSADMFLNSK